MVQPKGKADDIPRDIYKQVCDEHRFYGDMRFKQLSLYGVITALLVNAMNSKDVATAAISVKAMCVIALLSTSVLWVMEVRSSSYGYRCQKMRDHFETSLTSGSGNVVQHVTFHWTLLNATNMVFLLYVLSYWFWLREWWMVLGPQATVRRYSAIAWFIALILFSVREYWPRWREHKLQWKW